MKPVRSSLVKVSAKTLTGVTGCDGITGDGLPHGRTTLLVGGPGSGKTLFALQFLVHGARVCKEPGILVAFEGTASRIAANAESFGWKLAELRRKKRFLMDAKPMPDVVQAGDFDLGGMPETLDAKAVVKLAPPVRMIVGALSQMQTVLDTLGREVIAK